MRSDAAFSVRTSFSGLLEKRQEQMTAQLLRNICEVQVDELAEAAIVDRLTESNLQNRHAAMLCTGTKLRINRQASGPITPRCKAYAGIRPPTSN